MNILRSFLVPAVFAVAITAPAGAYAQQAAIPVAQASSAQCGQQMHRGGGHNPLAGLNLTAAQKAQIKQIHAQFRAQYPCGSRPSPNARQQMRRQILNVLTPQQRAQLLQSHPNY